MVDEAVFTEIAGKGEKGNTPSSDPTPTPTPTPYPYPYP